MMIWAASACTKIPKIEAPEPITHVMVLRFDNEGRFQSLEPLQPVQRPIRLGDQSSGQLYVAGYTRSQLDALGAPEDPSTERFQPASTCDPLLVEPEWVVEMIDGVPTPKGALPSFPALTASWLPPRCGAGFECREDECAPVVTQIATGARHACAIWGSGKVSCWGANERGQSGQPMFDSISEAREVPIVDDAVAIAAGNQHTCAVRADGSVWCWGGNALGQLGRGIMEDVPASEPARVPGIEDAVSIAAGGFHGCAVQRDGRAYCWGRGEDGELGEVEKVNRASPTLVPQLQDIVQIVAGDQHTCAVDRSGELFCFGQNTDGQSGPSDLPLPGIASEVEQVVAGRRHTCALVQGGEALCFGSNAFGQSSAGGVSFGVPIRFLTAGGESSCAVLEDGQAFCWGANERGQHGFLQSFPFESFVPQEGPSGSWAQLRLGARFGCGLDLDGRVQCWGFNGQGELGRRTSGIVQEAQLFSNVVQVAPGDEHTCAILEDRSVSCVGRNGEGQLGRGTRTYAESQGRILGLRDVTDLACGDGFTCVISEGLLYCFGAAGWASQGGFVDVELSPVRVGMLERSVEVDAAGGQGCVLQERGEVWCWALEVALHAKAELRAATQISCGLDRCCALAPPGEVLCWSPGRAAVPVSGIEGAIKVDAGGRHACALMPTGRVMCWGDNDHGQLGDDTRAPSAAPVEVLDIDDATDLVVGGSHGCVVRSDASVWCWGDNGQGQLNRDSSDDQGRPVELPTLRGLPQKRLAAGMRHGCVQSETPGDVWCWGWNSHGQADPMRSAIGDGAQPVSGLP